MSDLLPRHLSIDLATVRRRSGDSFARQTAYILRSRATNPRTGQVHDFRREGPIEASGMAGWRGSLEQLVLAATSAEKRRDAVEGRILIVALAHELSGQARLESVQDLSQHLVNSFGVPVVWALHPPPPEGDDRNWHAHLLFASRRAVGAAALGAKTRELDVRTSSSEHVEELREFWCATMNSELERAGHDGNCEHRSFARLGIARRPSRHLGERRMAAIRRERATEHPFWSSGHRPPLPTPAPYHAPLLTAQPSTRSDVAWLNLTPIAKSSLPATELAASHPEARPASPTRPLALPLPTNDETELTEPHGPRQRPLLPTPRSRSPDIGPAH